MARVGIAHSAALIAVLVVSGHGAVRAQSGAGALVFPADDKTDTAGVKAALESAGLVPRELGKTRDALTAAATAEVAREQKARDAIAADLAGAKRLYLEQNYDHMVTVLTARRDATLWLTARRDHLELLWQLSFQIGLAHHSRGEAGGGSARKDRRAAAAQFAFAHAIRPQQRPPADIYGPDVGQAFAAAIASQSGAATRQLRVTVTPSDATITVDGVALVAGSSRPVSSGVHVVRATAPGHTAVAKLVDASKDDAVTLALSARKGDAAAVLGPSWQRGEVRPGTPTANKLLADLARAHDASVVVWVGGESPVEVIILGKGGNTARHTDSSAAAAIEQLSGRIDASGAVHPAPNVIGTGGDNGGGSSSRTWWIVGGVGLAAAVVITAVVIASTGDGGGNGDRIQIGIAP